MNGFKEIKCPKNLNQFLYKEPCFENTYPEEECEEKKFYGDCWHCFSTAIAKRDKALKESVVISNKVGHWIMPQQDDGMSDPIYYQVRCSKCGFDLDPQTWHQELHQYDADKFCPKCGCPMEIER